MPKRTLNDFLSPASFWPVKEVSVSAWVEHAPFIFWLIDAMRPKSVVELGTHTGFSLFAMAQAATEIGLKTDLYAIDTWVGEEHAGEYGPEVLQNVREIAERDYPDLIHLVQATFADARPQFKDGSIDLVHVDGRHFYDDVRTDVEMYLPTLSKRGVMVLHDIAVHERDFGVYKLWDELQQQYPTFSFEHGNGLGIMAVGDDVPAPIKELTSLEPDSDLANLVREAYARLGAAVPTPWVIDDPGVVAALNRLPEAEDELRRARTKAEVLADDLAQERTRASRAAATEAAAATPVVAPAPRQAFVLRVAGKVPGGTRVTRGVLRRVGMEPPSPEDAQVIREIFDPQWYSSQYGINGTPEDLLRDYMTDGAAAGRNPSLLFDDAWYVKQNPDLAHLTPLQRVRHYVKSGGSEGRSPHPFFDGEFYLQDNPDIAGGGINPMLHYYYFGDAEGRRPNPYFDPTWVRQVTQTTGMAARTYLEWTGSPLSPSREFDPAWYASAYEDAAASDLDPLVFHLTYGEDRPATEEGTSTVRLLQRRWGHLEPLRTINGTETGRITLVTDSVSADSLFGGVATALIIAAAWANETGRGLRILTRQSKPSTQGCYEVWKHAGIPAPARLDFELQQVGGDGFLDVGDDELWLTTSNWTTASVRAAVNPDRVVYVLQEDERQFYPSGDESLRAWGEMTDPRGLTLVNSARLYDFLVADGAANLVDRGMPFHASFEAFTQLHAERPFRERRELFFYSRPNNFRNLFYLGVETLYETFGRGVLNPDEWTVHCAGPGTPADLSFPRVRTVIHEAMPWPVYTRLLAGIDVGLSLMSTPHTSYPPLDLISVGAQVVTNSWPGKVGLEEYGPRLLVAEPTVSSLMDSLAEADRRSRDGEVDASTPAVLTKSWPQQLAPVIDRLVAEYGRV